MSGNSSVSAKRRKVAQPKPEKPYPDFPLFPHATRRWAKKIRGKLHYFGPWDDPDAALTKYLAEKDYLHAGRRPPENVDGLTVRELANRFLSSKRHLLDTGEITQRTFRDYYVTCDKIVSVFGRGRLVEDVAADDFEKLRKSLAKKRGPVALGNEIGRVRMLFKYAFDQGLTDRPVRYGQGFKKPSRKTLRKARAANGKRMFEAGGLRSMVDAAGVPLKAMLLLGINCGAGQSDIACLPQSAIDLEAGWLDFPRPKTGVDRRAPLWPETVAALRDALQERPTPSDEADVNLVFVTKYGNRWVRTTDSDEEKKRGMSIDSVAQECRKLLNELGLKRGRLNFYALRHTFQTIGERSADLPAVKAIMGHVDDSMSGVYREGFSDDRLKKVTDTVHAWLFPVEAEDDQQEGGSE